MNEKTMLEKYIEYVKTCIGDKGIYPAPGWVLGQDDKLMVVAMDLPPGQVYGTMIKLGKKENAKEIAFGLDRYNKEGQGIDMCYQSVFTIIYVNLFAPSCVITVLPYNSQADIGELQYDNKWWRYAITKELETFFYKYSTDTTVSQN